MNQLHLDCTCPTNVLFPRKRALLLLERPKCAYFVHFRSSSTHTRMAQVAVKGLLCCTSDPSAINLVPPHLGTARQAFSDQPRLKRRGKEGKCAQAFRHVRLADLINARKFRAFLRNCPQNCEIAVGLNTAAH